MNTIKNKETTTAINTMNNINNTIKPKLYVNVVVKK